MADNQDKQPLQTSTQTQDQLPEHAYYDAVDKQGNFMDGEAAWQVPQGAEFDDPAFSTEDEVYAVYPDLTAARWRVHPAAVRVFGAVGPHIAVDCLCGSGHGAFPLLVTARVNLFHNMQDAMLEANRRNKEYPLIKQPMEVDEVKEDE